MEILADFDFELDTGHRELAWTAGDEPIAASVKCAVHRDTSLDQDAANRNIRWRRDGDHIDIATRWVRARLVRIDEGSFAASASVGTAPSAVSCLTTALSTAAIFAQGGLVLHAAGIELDGRAFLFIGPAGAGKTTTANAHGRGRWLARDRAAIDTIGGKWAVAGMAGGDPIALERSVRRVVPLGGIFRIVKGSPTTHVEPLGRAAMAHALRESIQFAAADRDEEVGLLDRTLALTTHVPIAKLHVRLGDPVLRTIEDHLHETAHA
jgi:hypothetical protein